MNILFELIADAEQVRVHVPQAELDETFSNLIAYDQASLTILGVGEGATEISEDAAEWLAPGQAVAVARPFAADDFQPELILALLYLYSVEAHERIRTRPVLAQLRRAFQIDRFDYVLQIAGYEELGMGMQKRFGDALRLFRDLPVNSFSVNGARLDK